MWIIGSVAAGRGTSAGAGRGTSAGAGRGTSADAGRDGLAATGLGDVAWAESSAGDALGRGGERIGGWGDDVADVVGGGLID